MNGIIAGNEHDPFVVEVLTLVHLQLLKDAYNNGYRISVTGHSLGGFLAQVCMMSCI